MNMYLVVESIVDSWVHHRTTVKASEMPPGMLASLQSEEMIRVEGGLCVPTHKAELLVAKTTAMNAVLPALKSGRAYGQTNGRPQLILIKGGKS